MFEYYITCDFCGKRNRLIASHEKVTPICGNCKNKLSLAAVEETIDPANITVLKKSEPFSAPATTDTKQEDGCVCGCVTAMIAIFIFLFAASSDKKLDQPSQLQQKRIEETKRYESLGQTKSKENQSSEQTKSEENQSSYLTDLKQAVQKESSKKSWKKFKASQKAEFWSTIYQKCKETNISAALFWQEFGNMIEKDFSPPPRISSDISLKHNAKCPFTITTSDRDSMYYVKLISVQNNKEIRIFFKGNHFETKIPPGAYQFRYCTGRRWYGPVFLFGPEKNYFSSNQHLNFSVRQYSDGISYEGHTIELIKQIGGNFRTNAIDETGF